MITWFARHGATRSFAWTARACCSFQNNRPTLWCGRDGDGSNLAVRYSQVSKGKMAGWLVLVSQQVVIQHGSTPSN